MIDIKKMEESNPVFNTAKFTLLNLANSGVAEAKEYLELLGFDSEKTAEYGYGENGNTQEMLIANAVTQESRYRAMNRIAKESGNNAILDLACGFSPRGLLMTEEQTQYIGADLPATVEILKQVGSKIQYQPVDVTNPIAMLACAECFSSPVTIITEGLLMYLDIKETEQYIEGIKLILKKCGGCLITPDYNSKDFYCAVVFAMFGREKGMQILINMQSSLSKTADVEMKKNFNSSVSDEEKLKFYTSRGLKVEFVPYCTPDTVLGSLSALDKETAERIKEQLCKTVIWKITLDENADVLSLSDADFVPENWGSYSVCGDRLEAKLQGRIDSINAPEVTDTFEKLLNENSIKSALIDAADLEYISSAGLRALLTLKKKIPGAVTILNTSDDIKDIFEVTGFDMILNIA